MKAETKLPDLGKQEPKQKADEPKLDVSGDKATIKARLPYLSIHEFDGVKYQVTAVLSGGYVELTRKA